MKNFLLKWLFKTNWKALGYGLGFVAVMNLFENGEPSLFCVITGAIAGIFLWMDEGMDEIRAEIKKEESSPSA